MFIKISENLVHWGFRDILKGELSKQLDQIRYQNNLAETQNEHNGLTNRSLRTGSR